MSHRMSHRISALLLVLVAACTHRVGPDTRAQRPADRNRAAAGQVVEFTEAERSRYTRVEHMIANNFAGVTVVPTGNTFAITIRGTGTFGSTSTEPLVIIDGAHRGTADLRGVDPRDVTRIEIIKDSAASLYGVRAANGVIVITTRNRK